MTVTPTGCTTSTKHPPPHAAASASNSESDSDLKTQDPSAPPLQTSTPKPPNPAHEKAGARREEVCRTPAFNARSGERYGQPAPNAFWKHTKSRMFSEPFPSQSAVGSCATNAFWNATKSRMFSAPSPLKSA